MPVLPKKVRLEIRNMSGHHLPPGHEASVPRERLLHLEAILDDCASASEYPCPDYPPHVAMLDPRQPRRIDFDMMLMFERVINRITHDYERETEEGYTLKYPVDNDHDILVLGPEFFCKRSPNSDTDQGPATPDTDPVLLMHRWAAMQNGRFREVKYLAIPPAALSPGSPRAVMLHMALIFRTFPRLESIYVSLWERVESFDDITTAAASSQPSPASGITSTSPEGEDGGEKKHKKIDDVFARLVEPTKEICKKHLRPSAKEASTLLASGDEYAVLQNNFRIVFGEHVMVPPTTTRMLEVAKDYRTFKSQLDPFPFVDGVYEFGGEWEIAHQMLAACSDGK